MKLIIAEKPSLARAIADGLPGQQVKKDGHIAVGDYVVAWCFGHLLELKMPEHYNPEYKDWAARPAPFFPERWEMQPTKDKAAQVRVISNLAKNAEVVINAGDPDREGSYLVDSVIRFIGFKGPVWRLLVADVNVNAVKKAISKMAKTNSTANMSRAAECRSKADWLYGINLTTAYTLAGRASGYNGVLSVGRVQTPVLGLLVRRKKERDSFVPVPFFEVQADILKGDNFTAQAKIEGPESYFDSEGRLLNGQHGRDFLNSVSGHPATVSRIESKESVSTAPALYSLAELQKDGNKALSLTASDVLQLAQELYLKGITTYPRSDCQYISSELWADAAGVLHSLSQLSNLAAAKNAQPELKHSCVNDAKVGAHHAIIPTGNLAGLSDLSQKHKDLFQLIALRYIAIFYPAAKDEKTKVELSINSKIFSATGTIEKVRGWRDVLSVKNTDKVLPSLAQGEVLQVGALHLDSKMTSPPSEFTEAALIGAMTSIAKYVTSDELKAILKETDGLGTEATRAAIIEGLIKRGFIERSGKKILPTESGVQFIEQLPEIITTPDMTATWESQLKEISEGQGSADAFLSSVKGKVTELVQNPAITVANAAPSHTCLLCVTGPLKRIKLKAGGYFWKCQADGCEYSCNDARGKPAEKALYKCPSCDSRLSRRLNDNGSWWWGCTGWKEGCKYRADDLKGKPVEREEKKASAPLETSEKKDCPDCGKPMKLRPGKYGNFWGCSGYPACKKTVKAE